MRTRDFIARDSVAHVLYARAQQPYDRLRAEAERERMLAGLPARSGSRLMGMLLEILAAAGNQLRVAGNPRWLRARNDTQPTWPARRQNARPKH